MAGLSINYDKPALIPLNCSEDKVRELKKSMECEVSALLITYLGIPLGANSRRVATWKPILNKIEKKLSCWKAKMLSKAGRLVIIKAMLDNLPICYLGLFKMPKMVAKR